MPGIGCSSTTQRTWRSQSVLKLPNYSSTSNGRHLKRANCMHALCNPEELLQTLKRTLCSREHAAELTPCCRVRRLRPPERVEAGQGGSAAQAYVAPKLKELTRTPFSLSKERIRLAKPCAFAARTRALSSTCPESCEHFCGRGPRPWKMQKSRTRIHYPSHHGAPRCAGRLVRQTPVRVPLCPVIQPRRETHGARGHRQVANASAHMHVETRRTACKQARGCCQLLA